MVCILNVFTYIQHNIKRKAKNESLKKNKLFVAVKKYKSALSEDILNYRSLKYRSSIHTSKQDTRCLKLAL